MGIASLTPDQIRALLTKEPSTPRPGDPKFSKYRQLPSRLTAEEYEAWIKRLAEIGTESE